MTKQEQRFVEMIWQHYREQGRHDLPWRQTTDPYKILVSELMLQQTQVERVVPKYRAFVRVFPSARRLAAAPLREVLKQWQGLGYNRRAKYVREAAIVVSELHRGRFPKDMAGLRGLPGVGPYTAGAIMAFAYNEPVPLIETNIRQVYLHHLFKDATGVSDSEVLRLVERTLPANKAREWYWALMDYGAHLKAEFGNLNHRSKHYTKQSKFYGSDREIRGAIIRAFTQKKQPLTKKQLITRLVEVEPRRGGKWDGERVAAQLTNLVTEGMVINTHSKYYLPS